MSGNWKGESFTERQGAVSAGGRLPTPEIGTGGLVLAEGLLWAQGPKGWSKPHLMGS